MLKRRQKFLRDQRNSTILKLEVVSRDRGCYTRVICVLYRLFLMLLLLIFVDNLPVTFFFFTPTEFSETKCRKTRGLKQPLSWLIQFSCIAIDRFLQKQATKQSVGFSFSPYLEMLTSPRGLLWLCKKSSRDQRGFNLRYF